MVCNMGPCDDNCIGCRYIFRSSGKSLPICDYYLETGKHRYAGPDGICAVRDDGKVRYSGDRSRQRRKRRSVPWDEKKALEMWLQGYMVKTIGEVVGTSSGNLCIYAQKHWERYRAQRDAAIAEQGGIHAKNRR